MTDIQYIIQSPSTFGEGRGRTLLPSSKSISNRALVINRLAGNDCAPDNVSDCDDTRVMLAYLTPVLSTGEGASKSPATDASLGKKPPLSDASLDKSNLKAPSPVERAGERCIDIGAAGTAMRFSTALLAVSEGEHIITGTERMKNRPIGVLVDALRELGAQIEYVEKEGFPPLKITGNSCLEGGELRLPGNVSSQYVSALLMIAPVLRKGLRLTLTGNIVSRPYIDMTLAIMRDFGAECGWEDTNIIYVEPRPYQKRDYCVESDWSAASYWYEMVALAPNDNAEVVLPGLFAESLQGDSKVAQMFEQLGVSTEHRGNEVVVRKTRDNSHIPSLSLDFIEQPDLAQTFVVTCCMLGVPFHFTGLQSLKIKETDRIFALKKELAKLGFVLEDRNDSELLWDGTRAALPEDELSHVAIDTYEDHRMAMAFAPAALKLGSIKINNPQVVSKSYPRFWDDLQAAGFVIEKR